MRVAAAERAAGPRQARARTRRGPAPPSAAGPLANDGNFAAYGLATKFWVFDVANVDDADPLPHWLTFHIRFAVDGSGVTAA